MCMRHVCVFVSVFFFVFVTFWFAEFAMRACGLRT